MQAEDLLATLVEFSVAVAGFSGVVAAISPRRPVEWSQRQRGFFSALLGSTAISAGVAILAMILLSSPMSTAAAWTTASCAHAVALVGAMALRSRELRSHGNEINPTSVAILVAVVGLLAAQTVNALAVHAGWLCVAALGVYAFLALIYFIVLVRELWGESLNGRTHR